MKILTLITFVTFAAFLEVKADFCPESLDNTDCDQCFDNCGSDRDCDQGMSCCREKCGNVCRQTPDVNKGVPSRGWSCGNCPSSPKSDCDLCKDECGPSLKCMNDQSCCKTKCGNKCSPQSQVPRGRKAERMFCERQTLNKTGGIGM